MSAGNYSKWTAHHVPPQHGRVDAITGGNRVLGLAVARVLAERKASLVLAVRNAGKGQKSRRANRGRRPRRCRCCSAARSSVLELGPPRRPSSSQDSPISVCSRSIAGLNSASA